MATLGTTRRGACRSLLGGLAFLLLAGSAAAAPVLVQTNSAANGGNGTSISVSFASPPTAGDLLVAMAGNRSSTSVSSIPAGWSNAVEDPGQSPGHLIIYKVADAAEPSDVTITYTSGTRLGLQIYEYSGITGAVLRQVAGNTGSGASLTSATVTTTTNDELVIAGFAINDNTSFTSWSNSFAERNDFLNSGATSSQSTYGGADRVAPTPGSYSTTAVVGGSGAWIGQIARFSFSYSISGTVFEDVNYGGGAGRDSATASGVGRSGARLELYDNAGAFLRSTTSQAGGAYAFAGLASGTYTVRVVNDSVSSSRTGYTTGLEAVQTFRTDASSGSAAAVTDRVGGQNPSVADAGAGSAGATLNTTTGVFSAGPSGTAQSIAGVTLGTSNLTDVDFGFNFNTIVNVNDAGQGSLRQFILNSNALGNAGLAIQGQPAGEDVSVFMISDGLAHPGLRAGLANLLDGSGVAVIAPVTALPAITGASTTLDGTTQTANTGNTNPVVLGAGGSVGVDGLALATVAGPEVEIAGSGAIANGLLIQAASAVVRGFSIHGFGTAAGDAGVRVDAFAGALIENNVLGARATSFTDPGAAARNAGGVYSAGGSNGIVRHNLIGFGRDTDVYLTSASTGWTVTGNEIRDSGEDTSDGNGIAISASSTNTASGNLITGCSSQGFLGISAGTTGNTFVNNTVTGNGVGLPSGQAQSTAITLRTGVVSTTLDRNVIRANYGAGLQVNNGATGTRITRNSITLNGTTTARNGAGATGQIGIDLNSAGDNINFGTAPFYTLNDAGDTDAGANGLLNYPVLVSATLSGANLVLTGYARPGSVIELFIADPDPSGFGEGETYLLTLTEGGTGAGGNDPYADTDAGTGSYGPGAVNGIAQGTDNTNRFAFTFPAPGAVSAGARLTATATLAGETSEFSGLVTVGAAVAGTVFEDIAGDGLPGGQSIGDAANPGRGAVTVRLYLDDGDNLPGAGDALTATTATIAGGGFVFLGLGPGTYWLAADSRTVTPSAGLRGGFAPGDVWAEQTFGAAGARRSDGAGGTAARLSPGACYGGQRGSQSDDATALASSEHVTQVVVAGTSIAGVDFGFSFNVVTSMRGGDTADDDGGNNRTVQGSLRQFIQNANAILGANASRFVPVVATNASGNGGNWWSLGVTASLPAIADASTTIDGAAYDLADGTTARDTNPGQLGAGGTVGVDALPLSKVDRPELEIRNLRAITPVSTGLDLQAAGVTIRDLAIFGFGTGVFNNNFTNIATRAAAANALIERNVIGSDAGSFVDPGAASRTDGAAIIVDGGTGGTLRNNLIGYATGHGVWLLTAGDSWTVTNNEVRGNALGASKFVGGIQVDAGTGQTITQNLVVDNQSIGIHVSNAPGNHALRDNTIAGNGTGDPPNQTSGVRVANTTASLLELNVIDANYGAGVLITSSATGIAISRNAITSNGTIANAGGQPASGQIGIDLLSASDGQARGTAPFVTPNDAGDGDAGGNGLLNFPIVTSAIAAGGAASVNFDLDVPAGSYRIEFFRNPSGVDPSGHGEGEVFAGSTVITHPGGGTRSFALAIPASAGDSVTATSTSCTDGVACTKYGSTSEFGAAFAVRAPVIVKRAFQLDGTPIPSGAVLPRGTPFRFLLYVNNPGGAVSDVTLRDALDSAFGYQPGSIRYDASTPSCPAGGCSAAQEAAIYAAANSGTAGSDGANGDVVSFSGGILDAGNQNVGNAQLDLPAGRVWAIVFTVRMQ